MNEILKKRVEEAAEEYVMGNSASYVECFEAGARYVLDRLCSLPWDETLKTLADYAEQRLEDAL